MSVERRGDNNLSTVQRRGEKKSFLPNRDHTPPKLKPEPVAQQAVADERVEPKIVISVKSPSGYMSNKDIASFEARVQQRIAHYEAYPADKKEFLKQTDGWIAKIVFAMIFFIAIPPLAGVVIALLFVYLLFKTWIPKAKQEEDRVKMRRFAENIAVAIKLKQTK